jgi:ankyrin repeat protein
VAIASGIGENAEVTLTSSTLAAERGHIELVKVLLKNGADVNAANLNGESALMRAAENDRAAAVKILLAHHANGNAGDIINCTPLMRAAYRGYVDVVKELLAHGADANARNAFGNTAATLAARNGHGKVESMLRKADGISLVDPVQPKPRAARR